MRCRFIRHPAVAGCLRWLWLSLPLWLLALPARADIDCWMDAEHPRTGDNLSATDTRVQPLRRALQEVNALLRRMPELQALPRTRLRSSWQIGGQWTAPARAANFLLRDHRESMWVGRCGVLTGADRLEPHASIVISFNAPHSVFVSEVPDVKDEQLQAWREEPVTGQVQGRPLYGGHMLVFTSTGRLPWVPVTTAEYLDFTERDLTRRRAEAQANRQAADAAATPEANEAVLQRVADGLRKTNPAQAEALIAQIRAQDAQARTAAAAADARRRARPGVDDDPYGTMLQRLRVWRSGLSAQQLLAQARLGYNGLQPADVPPERFAPLAKPDPSFAWSPNAPSRPQVLKISVRGNDEFAAPMQRVLQALDTAALQALVQPR
jgi:hypothetical protein